MTLIQFKQLKIGTLTVAVNREIRYTKKKKTYDTRLQTRLFCYEVGHLNMESMGTESWGQLPVVIQGSAESPLDHEKKLLFQDLFYLNIQIYHTVNVPAIT